MGRVWKVFLGVFLVIVVLFLSLYVKPFGVKVNRKNLYDTSNVSNAVKSIEKDKYGDHFEIQYFWGPSADTIVSQGSSAAQKIENAGFTIAPLSCSHSGESIWTCPNLESALSILDARHLKTIVSTGGITDMAVNSLSSLRTSDNFSIIKNQVNGHANVVGYDVLDEPSVERMNNWLIPALDVIHNEDAMRFSYVNLFPNYAGKGCLRSINDGCTGANNDIDLSYYANEYLAYFYNNTNVKYISVDHYLNLLNSSNFSSNRERLYSNLRDVLNVYKTKKNNHVFTIPMNIVTLTDTFINPNNKSHIVYQVNTDLAFGMKGLSFFTYEHAPGNAWTHGDLVDTAGNTTTQYMFVKDINSWAFNVGNELFDKEVLGVYDISGEVMNRIYPSGSADENDKISDLGTVSIHTTSKSASQYVDHTDITSTNGRALISYFDDGTYMMVNSELSNSIAITIPNLPLRELEYFDSYNNQWVPISFSDSQLNDASYVIKTDMFTLHPNRNSVILDSGYAIMLRLQQGMNSVNSTTYIDRVNHNIITYSNSLYDTFSSLDGSGKKLKVNGNEVVASNSNDIKLSNDTKIIHDLIAYDVHGITSSLYKISPAYVYTDFHEFNINNIGVTSSSFIGVSAIDNNNYVSVSYSKNGKQLRNMPIISTSISNHKVYKNTIYTNGLNFNLSNLSIKNGVIENNDNKVQVYTWPKKVFISEYSIETSPQNYLKSISSSAGSLSEEFSKTKSEYTIHVSNSVTSVDLVGSAEVNTSVVTNASNHNLAVGNNLLTISVKDKAGFVREYNVNVVRDANAEVTPTPVPSHNNADLKSLSVEGYSLSPSFSSSITSYIVKVPNTETSVNVSASAFDAQASIRSGVGSVNLTSDTTVVTVEVVAQDGTEKSYNISFEKVSDNANLSSLSVGEYSLNPVFNSSITSYSIVVPSNVNSIVVDAVLEDNNASVKSGVGEVALNSNSTMVNVVVESALGNQKTYSISVRKLSNDTSLKTLKVNGKNVTLSDGDTYSINIPSDENRVVIDAIAASGRDVVLSENDISIDINETKSFVLEVTAEDSNVSKEYTLIVHRQSVNTGISKVTVSNYLAILSEDGTYHVSLPYKIDKANIVVEKTDDNQVIEVSDNNSSLEVGIEKVFKILVTNDKTNDHQEYSVSVVRNEASNNSFLKSITVISDDSNFSLSPSFNKEVYEYNIEVPSKLDSIHLDLSGDDANSSLEYPKNVILDQNNVQVDVVVVAENGSKRTYVLHFLKKVSLNDDNQSDDIILNTSDDKGKIINPKTGHYNIIFLLFIAVVISLVSGLIIYRKFKSE